MPEIRNVQIQQVDERCPACGQGYMRPTGIVKMVHPPLYQHKCTHCEYIQDYRMTYPHLISK